jgi:hypothetical protein
LSSPPALTLGQRQRIRTQTSRHSAHLKRACWRRRPSRRATLSFTITGLCCTRCVRACLFNYFNPVCLFIHLSGYVFVCLCLSITHATVKLIPPSPRST